MKKIILFVGMFLISAGITYSVANDDVYDAPQPKKVRIKQSYEAPKSTTTTPVYSPPEQQVVAPYTDEENSSSRISSANRQSTNNDDRYSSQDYYADNIGFGYSDRIVRFHNPSIRFNYNYSNMNGYYDPWNSNMYWNNSYIFTPSWTYGYSNFYNPFWGNQIIIINQPWMSSWYSGGYYSPYNNWNSWNNIGWNGFSPYCSNAIFNNGFNNYGGYYDYNKKNVVYTPRTGGYSNTNNYTGNNNYTKNYPTNTNTNSGWNVNGNTNTNSDNSLQTTPDKWSTKDKSNNSGKGWSNPYKNSNTTPSNNSNTTTSPLNNGWNNNSTSSPKPGNGKGGVKIGSRPK